MICADGIANKASLSSKDVALRCRAAKTMYKLMRN